jgi:hypothetical protein
VLKNTVFFDRHYVGSNIELTYARRLLASRARICMIGSFPRIFSPADCAAARSRDFFSWGQVRGAAPGSERSAMATQTAWIEPAKLVA